MMPIDVNGDGRIDIVDASEKPFTWVVYLNTPNPATPSGIDWYRRAYDITNLYTEFVQRNLLAANGGYLPLSARYSGRNYNQFACWHWNKSSHTWSVSGATIQNTNPNADCYSGGQVLQRYTEKTWTLWELKDINGDGYPD